MRISDCGLPASCRHNGPPASCRLNGPPASCRRRRFAGFRCPGAPLTIVLLLLATIASADTGWVSGGPFGGSIQAFAFHPTRENLIFASGLDGLFRSTDTGLHWERLEIDGGESVVRIHPANPGLILAASSAHGVYATTNQGDSWEMIHRYAFHNDSFYDMEFHPGNPEILYAISYYNGVFRSTDTGRTWTGINKGLQKSPVADCCVDLPQIEIDPSNPEIVYALLPSRMVFRSDDGGNSWKTASHGLKFTDEVHALAIDPRNTLVLYAGGANGIFRTLNGGQQWSSRGCGCYIWSFAVNPHNAREVYGVGEGAVKSMDGGKKWEWFTPHPFLSGILLGVGVHPKKPDLVLVGGFGGGIFRSTDAGRNWDTVNHKLDALNVVRMAADPSTPGRLLAVGGQQAFESRDGGKHWDLFLKGQGSVFWVSDISIHPRNPKLIAAAGYRKTPGALTLSTDGGKTWQVRSPYSGVNYGCSQCLALDPSDNRTMYLAPFLKKKEVVTQLGVAKSTDQGKSWTLINKGITAKDIWLIAVSPANSSVLYAGTGGGRLFRSEDAGKSWTAASAGLDLTSIRSIAFDPSSEKTLYVATYASVFKSADGGKSWSRKNQGLPDGAWWNFVDVDRRTPAVLYAAGEAGLFISRDAGESWMPHEGRDRVPFAAWNYLIDPANPNRRYMGTDRGVFVRE